MAFGENAGSPWDAIPYRLRLRHGSGGWAETGCDYRKINASRLTSISDDVSVNFHGPVIEHVRNGKALTPEGAKLLERGTA